MDGDRCAPVAVEDGDSARSSDGRSAEQRDGGGARSQRPRRNGGVAGAASASDGVRDGQRYPAASLVGHADSVGVSGGRTRCPDIHPSGRPRVLDEDSGGCASDGRRRDRDAFERAGHVVEGVLGRGCADADSRIQGGGAASRNGPRRGDRDDSPSLLEYPDSRRGACDAAGVDGGQAVAPEGVALADSHPVPGAAGHRARDRTPDIAVSSVFSQVDSVPAARDRAAAGALRHGDPLVMIEMDRVAAPAARLLVRNHHRRTRIQSDGNILAGNVQFDRA